MKHTLETDILQLLSKTNEPMSAYQIMKELRKRTHISSVQKAVKRLEDKRLIKTYERIECRTGLYSKKYVLGVNGILKYLGSEKPPKNAYEMMENYAQFYNYSVFKYWKQITECFGKNYVLKALSHSVAHVRTREFYTVFSEWKPDIKIKVANMDIDDLLVHTLTYHLFARLRLTRKTIINNEILNIIEATLKTELDIIEKERQFTFELAKAYKIDL
jgi:predicted transcriptional regulator